MAIFMNEQGDIVDFLAERNEEIKSNLSNTLEIFKEKEAKNTSGKKRFGFMFSMQINNELNKYPKLTASEFYGLDADDISHYWNSYYDLMCYYNLYFEIVPNKQGFLRYFGINARQYQQLQEHQDEDIRSEIVFIEDALKGDAFRAGENGNTDAKAIGFRMTARGADGHNIISASEDKLITEVVKRSPMEMFRQLEQITSGGGKLLK